MVGRFYIALAAGAAFGIALATPLFVFLASWALASLRSPLGEPPWSWVFLLGVPFVWFIASLPGFRRRNNVLWGASIGIAGGMLLGLSALLLLGAMFRASHPGGFYVGVRTSPLEPVSTTVACLKVNQPSIKPVRRPTTSLPLRGMLG